MSKKEYFKPEIEIYNIDNEISLSLESDPAPGPGEGYIQDYKTNDPFKDNLV